MGFAENDAYAAGGEGAADLARLVVDTIDKNPSKPLQFAYNDEDTTEEKIEKVAKNIYGAASVSFGAAAKKKLQMIKELGFERFPVCIAKTQYSLSDNAKLLGRPQGHALHIRGLTASCGAGFAVALAGSVLTMPGLPAHPAAESIDVDDEGQVLGLF